MLASGSATLSGPSPLTTTPALLTGISSVPRRARILSAAFLMVSGLVTSSSMKCASVQSASGFAPAISPGRGLPAPMRSAIRHISARSLKTHMHGLIISPGTGMKTADSSLIEVVSRERLTMRRMTLAIVVLACSTAGGRNDLRNEPICVSKREYK
jgi:hypothetical protein